jgi:UDP-glucose 4-epimerase
VYGEPAASPVSESAACRPESPYGRSKWMVEQMLTDLCRARSDWQIALLRYFNPVGAHSSGRLGEQPQGVPNNLMPYLCQVATGQRAQLVIHGADYPTEDGTGVRDYIHVMDLAEGHVAALRRARQHCGVMTFNLGTGQGASVLEVVSAFERACGRPLARTFGPRRAGDVPAYWADVALAERSLHWRARRGLDDMCMDSWRWQSRNPQGYASPASQALVG